MFRLLAPFVGGCSLEAADWMVRDGRDDPNAYGASERRGVIDLLASLVEKSLVRQEETGEGEPRFQMLETIRQYGLGLLDSLGEGTAARRLQLDYFLELAMRAEPFLARLENGLQRPKNTRLGVDIAGRVEAIGKDVTQFQPGDDVFGEKFETGMGGFAEYVSVPERGLALKPANISFEAAAAVPLAARASSVSRRAGVREHGSGPFLRPTVR